MPTERINRRELIINTAADLFRKQGYTATSVRQIADEVGVTEAALYYHFKDGKRALFSEVVECNLPDFIGVLELCKDAQSLQEFVELYGKNMAKHMLQRISNIRWITNEYQNFEPEERALFHAKHMKFHNMLTAMIRKFVADDDTADKAAWMITCASFGYGMLFVNLELGKVADFRADDLTAHLSGMVAQYYEP